MYPVLDIQSILREMMALDTRLPCTWIHGAGSEQRSA